MAGGELLDRNLTEFLRDAGQCPLQLERFQGRDQDVAGPDLGLAEEQRGVMPAAVEHIDDVVGDAGHLRLVLAEALDDAADISGEAGHVEAVMLRGQPDIGRAPLQDLGEPVRQLDIAVAGPLGLAQRLNKGFIADAVEFAGDGFETDIGHGCLLDHDDFGSTRSKIINVIGSKSLERDSCEKPVPTFSHPALSFRLLFLAALQPHAFGGMETGVAAQGTVGHVPVR